ncbi:MAG: hydantoinase B/oxoprolinase family protein [Puniceicoccaceae bacterium]
MWKLSADTGGTFTDFLAESPDGIVRRGKVLSSGRLRTKVCGMGGDNSVLVEPLGVASAELFEGKAVWIGGVPAGRILRVEEPRLFLDQPLADHGAGAILEIDCELEAPVLAMNLLVPEFIDSKPKLEFRLGTTKGTNALLEKKGARVALFLSKGFEDLLLIRDQKRPSLFAKDVKREVPIYERVFGIQGKLDARGTELQPLDLGQVASMAREALASGCTTAAVCLLNSWINPDHEMQVMHVLEQEGFQSLSISSSIRPLIKYLDRAETTLVNGMLSPVMNAYLDRVEAEINGNALWVMTSAGGLASRDRFHAVDSLVSGPAGGVLGAVEAGRSAGLDKIIALDMGGTSTDVSRWKDQLNLRQQIQVGKARILTPALPIETVAAGGGSICGFKDGRLFVGPESAGADPGPASYGAGGPLCLTDIHLLLGRIDPKGFSIPIRLEDARMRLDEVMAQAGESDWQALARGFLAIATERMAHAIRQVTLRDGEDPSEYGLVAFGGAGGLHACLVAEELGIKRIIFPRDAGILSAKGIHYAPRETVRERQLFSPIDEASRILGDTFNKLVEDARADLLLDGVSRLNIDEPVCSVYVRISGQEMGIPIKWETGCDMEIGFRDRFVAIFGYYPKEPNLELVKIRVRLAEKAKHLAQEEFDLSTRVAGPHIICDPFSTCFVENGWEAVSGSAGSFELSQIAGYCSSKSEQLGNVEKTLIMNRLEGLVEEMGDQLKRTALSTNIRERLDFSCALLDNEGRLLVNAPHIPVHLGAMGLCVRESIKRLPLGPGDVLVTNHPAFGGSHLPDVTLVRALFNDHGELAGYIANRAHHAEWGGRTPGSMPADATRLIEEGVVIEPRYLIKDGQEHFAELESLLANGPFPSRAIRENRIDIEAQLASLVRGQQLFDSLLQDYGFTTVVTALREFYLFGASALAAALMQKGDVNGRASERLDDGSTMKVAITREHDGLMIDFTGTDKCHPGNLNATPAIVRSAVLYVLRLFVDTPMPLNEGLLDRVRIVLPECFLNPTFPEDISMCPAVVGGNVETSQRVVDLLIRALDLMAAGQGTMNNFLFGNKSFGYYETIGGGAGAGPGFSGASGTHVHMTNTAITDPEILEQRFSVRCREFSLRTGSGGKGEHDGGDGLVREIEFVEPVEVSLLSQNRKQGPRGMFGGANGTPGCQWHIMQDGTRIELEGISQVHMGAGDAIRVETPGGGGFGHAG